MDIGNFTVRGAALAGAMALGLVLASGAGTAKAETFDECQAGIATVGSCPTRHCTFGSIIERWRQRLFDVIWYVRTLNEHLESTQRSSRLALNETGHRRERVGG